MLTLHSMCYQPGFVTPLRGELLECKWTHTKWKILEPLIYVTHITDTPQLIYVRPGFVTDLASVPRLPLVFLLAGRLSHEPAVIHDWCYYKQLFPRSVCDKIFLEAMGTKNVNPIMAGAMYSGVVVGGWRAYNRYGRA